MWLLTIDFFDMVYSDFIKLTSKQYWENVGACLLIGASNFGVGFDIIHRQGN